MTLANKLSAGALLAAFIGGAWTYHLYIDRTKMDVQASNVRYEII